MSDGSNHIKTFTAADIERYHSGQMPAQEMHRLEKAALDDPFLADALEGYVHTSTAQADLAELKERLFSKTEDRKVIPLKRSNFFWLKIAASVIVFVAAGWLVVNLTNSSPKETLAKQESKPVSKEINTPEVAPSTTMADSSAANTTTIKSDIARDPQKQSPVQQQTDKTVTRRTTQNRAANITSSESDMARVPSYETRAVDSNYFRNQVLFNRSVASGPSQPRMNYFNGRVVDLNNRALPNATVVAENNVAFQTDKKGNFTIPASDSVLDATVKVNGYVANRATLNTNEQMVIVMKPLPNSAQLEEVVLDKSKKARVARKDHIVADTLEPTIGWTAYGDYIASQLNKQDDLIVTSTHGEVELLFDVNSKGEPVNITVNKSLCEKCDEKAIQILKEGPKWKRKKNKKGKVTIRF